MNQQLLSRIKNNGNQKLHANQKLCQYKRKGRLSHTPGLFAIEAGCVTQKAPACDSISAGPLLRNSLLGGWGGGVTTLPGKGWRAWLANPRKYPDAQLVLYLRTVFGRARHR
jgi:hypothetical protein